MSGIEEKMVLEFARNKIWQDAFYSLTTNYNMVALTHYAKLLGYSVDSLRSAFTTACKYPNEYIVPILEKNKLYSVPAKECGRRASILFRSDMPLTASTVIAGLKLATGGVSGFLAAVAGYGKAFLTGLGYAALVGAVIIGAIMGANFIAESWGTYGADDPIEPTWLGDPESRVAYHAEHEESTHTTTYGNMVATIDGVDVTHVSLNKPRYLYIWDDYKGWNHGQQFELKHVAVYNLSFPGIGQGDPFISTLTPDTPASGGPYKTYGQVCEDIEKKSKYYDRGEDFTFEDEYEDGAYKPGDIWYQRVCCSRKKL